LAKALSASQVAENTVELDAINLKYLSSAFNVGSSNPSQQLAAEYAQLSGNARVAYAANLGYPGHGFVTGYGTGHGAGTDFVVSVAKSGFYNIGLRYAAGPSSDAPATRSLGFYLNDRYISSVALPSTGSWNTWGQARQTVFLLAGINNLQFQGTGSAASDVNLDYVEVVPDAAVASHIQTYAAASGKNTLSGTAVVRPNVHAFSGGYVAGIGNGRANVLRFNQVVVPQAGTYRLIVYYSDGQFVNTASASVNSYNLNVVDRAAIIRVNGKNPQVEYFANTYAPDQFWAREVDVQLRQGANTISFGNNVAPAPNIEKIDVAPVELNSPIRGG
jgi:hypothetical protein